LLAERPCGEGLGEEEERKGLGTWLSVEFERSSNELSINADLTGSEEPLGFLVM
jgi:hypothetical protein